MLFHMVYHSGMSLALEAITVGLVLGLVLALFRGLVARRPFVAGVALGALIHLGFETVGANAWYCLHGAACRA